MVASVTDVRAALDALSLAIRPQLSALHTAVVAQCKGDEEPLFAATANLLEAVCTLEKIIAADFPALIDDVEAALLKTTRPLPLTSEDDGV